MPWQRYVTDVALEIDNETELPAYHTVIVVVMRQQGKALDVDTPVLTSDGWSTMGSLRPGDLVFSPDGSPVEVTHVFPFENDHDCYEVTTTDGRRVIADADHLWRVRDTANQPGQPWRTLTTRQMLEAGLRRAQGYRFQLPAQHELKSVDIELPLDPYLLGVWLGDGTAARAEVTSADQEIFDAFTAEGFQLSYDYTSGRARTRGLLGLRRTLREIGVLGNKHVPDRYLTAGTAQRLALIQGLLDTDGYVSHTSQVEFVSADPGLADAVLYLARSLGWKPSISGREGKWRVRFTVTGGDRPFRLHRKLERISGTRNVRPVAIKSIAAVSTRPVRCIKVNAKDGLFLAGHDLVPTHNTELLFPVMTHRCIGFADFGAQRVLYTTQAGNKAREKWQDIHLKRLQTSPYKNLFKARLRMTQEAMLWVNGSTWSPAAGTAKSSGTGDSIDFAAIDEAWSAEERRELGLRPAMITRPSRQLWLCSMVPGLSRAGTADSEYLRSKMAIGRSMVENDVRKGIAYFEYSAPETMDPSDPRTWFSCMPALCPAPKKGKCSCDPEGIWHHTVTESAIQADFDSLPLVDFCAEYLGWWPQDNRPTWTFVKERTWHELTDLHSQPRRAVAVGIDMDEDRQRVYISVAGYRADGDWHVEIVEPGQKVPETIEGTDWVVPRVEEIVRRNDVVAVVVDPHGPAQSLIMPLRNAFIEVETPNTLEISAQCERLFDAVTGPDARRRFRHLGQRTLTLAMAHARKLVSSKNRTFAWERIGGRVSIAPLYAVTLAMYGYEAKVEDDYDIRDSILSSIDGECPDCGKYPEHAGKAIEHYDDCELTAEQKTELDLVNRQKGRGEQ